MKKYLILSAMLAIGLGASGPAFSQSASGGQDLSKPAHPEPPMLGIHWARGFQPNYLAKHPAHGHGGPPVQSSSPLMTWHGGNILTTVTTASIFWGPSWKNSTFVDDKVTGLDEWYNGFNYSLYAGTSDEYSGANGTVTSATSYIQPDAFDYSTASGGNKTSAILAEVCKNFPAPVKNGYYAVYVDQPRKGNYCAYHSWGSCGGIPIEFAFFWNLDGDPGCDPQDTTTGHSQGLAALANVSAHELSEARTDPTGAGWYDSNGEENGDKCAWIFDGTDVKFSDGSFWKLQTEWSNVAYDATSDYPNSSGQNGCIDGDTPY